MEYKQNIKLTDMISLFLIIACIQISNINAIDSCATDLVFLVDNSDSVIDVPGESTPDRTNWNLMRQFTADVVSGLSVGSDELRVGYTTFSDRGTNRFYLPDYTDNDEVNDAILGLSFRGGRTNNEDGFYDVRRRQFNYSNKRRSETNGELNITRVLIYITDGKSSERTRDPIPEANRLRDGLNVRILGIGIGNEAKEEDSIVEMQNIVSPRIDGQSERYWLVSDFYDLNSIKDVIINEVCRESRNNNNGGESNDIESCPEGTPVDLTLLIESSDFVRDGPSIDNSDNWARVRSFASRIVDHMQISREETRVATVLYAETGSAWTASALDRFNNAFDIKSTIQSLGPLSGYSTDSTDALNYVRRNIYGSNYNGEGRRKVIVLMLSHASTQREIEDHTYMGQLLWAEGYDVITIGVGQDYENELNRLSSPPHYKGRTYFTVDYYDKLYELEGTVTQRLCQIGNSGVGQRPDPPSKPDSVEEPSEDDSCGSTTRLDLTIVIDGSNFVRYGQADRNVDPWTETLKLFADVVKRLPVNEDEVRVSAVVYSETGSARADFHLDRYTKRQDVVEAIESLRAKGGEITNSVDALQYAKDRVFRRNERDVQKVILLLLGGSSTEISRDERMTTGQYMYEEGIYILAVGVGERTTEFVSEVNSLSARPRYEGQTYFIKDNYNDLSTLVDTITTKLCRLGKVESQEQPDSSDSSENVATEAPLPPDSGEDSKPIDPDDYEYIQSGGCREAADVVFAIDSGGIGRDKWPEMLTFIGDVVADLDMRIVNVGIVIYSTKVTEILALNNTYKARELRSLIMQINYQPGSTNTHDAIRYSYMHLFDPFKGDRPNVQNYLVIATNGGTADIMQTEHEAFKAKAENIHIIVTAVGVSGDEVRELRTLTSHPSETNFLSVTNYNEMLRDRYIIRDFICNDEDDCVNNPCQYGNCIDSIGTYYCECVEHYGGKQCLEPCRKPTDVVFLLDDSSSVGVENFEKMLNFVRKTVLSMSITGFESTSRVGVITVGETAEVKFSLARHSTKEQILNALTIRYEGRGSTNMDQAIKLAREVFHGGDMGKDKVMIILTESSSDDPERAWAEAMQARLEDNIHILVIGIKDSVKQFELESMASYPVRRNVLSIDNYDTFFLIENYVTDTICDAVNECAEGPCINLGECMEHRNGYTCECMDGFTGANCERACDGGVDIAFLIDTSSSVNKSRFGQIKEYVSEVIDNLEISLMRNDERTHVAVVTFGSSATKIFSLDDYTRKQDVIQSVMNIKYNGGKTNLAAGILLIRDQIFDENFGDRLHKPNFLVVVTDGNSNVDDQLTVPQSIYARIQGVHIVVVTIGEDINMIEMKGIASMPETENILEIHDFDHLDQAVSGTIRTLCDDTDECQSNPCKYGGVCVNKLHRYECHCPNDRTGRQCQRVCHTQNDVAFLVDISGSLGNFYDDIISFIRLLVEGLDFTYGQNRLGLVTFDEDVKMQFHFDQYRTKEELLNAIHTSGGGGMTNTKAGLDFVGKEVFGESSGGREGIPHIVILFTDGGSNKNPRLTGPAAKDLKERGVQIIVVAIGDEVDMNEVNNIASYTHSPYVTRFVRFDDVYEKSDSVLDELCQ